MPDEEYNHFDYPPLHMAFELSHGSEHYEFDATFDDKSKQLSVRVDSREGSSMPYHAEISFRVEEGVFNISELAAFMIHDALRHRIDIVRQYLQDTLTKHQISVFDPGDMRGRAA